MHSSSLCLLYGSVSSVANLANKSLYSNFAHSFTFSYLFLQALFLLLVVKAFAPKFVWKEFKTATGFSVCFVCSLLFGLFGIGKVNLAMYVALRKLVTLMVYVWNFDRKHFDPKTALAVFGISLGALLAGMDDISASFQGYLCVLIANLLTAATFQQSHVLSSKHKITATSQCYYLSLITLPILGFCSWFYDHPSEFTSNQFAGSLMVCSIAGCLNNLLMLKCCSEVSPLATSVTGQIKDFITVVAGLILFTDAKSSWGFLLGLGVSMSSAVGFAILKLRS
mmetsp:Transcript_34342/g.60140  ORF Transcript_34342/g.60140 Transcript_34342/m.60140 type:complete len:281 (-) Transcript_34342:1748-2590(-)